MRSRHVFGDVSRPKKFDCKALRIGTIRPSSPPSFTPHYVCVELSSSRLAAGKQYQYVWQFYRASSFNRPPLYVSLRRFLILCGSHIYAYDISRLHGRPSACDESRHITTTTTTTTTTITITTTTTTRLAIVRTLRSLTIDRSINR
jgi:hypothetical protein